MDSEAFEIPHDFVGEVRLFPLNDLVFFPSNVLPLHIFESRYREMIEDALADDGLITMATLEPGHSHDYYSRPPVNSHVCIGKVTSCERLDDGRYNFMLIGLQRARIEHEIEPVRAFRRAQVSLIDESSAASAELGQQQRAELSQRVVAAQPALGSVITELLEREVSLDIFTDIFSFHLPLPVPVKLKLLAESDATARAELLLENLAPANPKRRFPSSFSDN